MAEIGVWKGEFARHILGNSSSVETYFMIDPWRNLPDWNKPANVDDLIFESILQEAMAATEFARERRKVLRGRTVDVIDQIPTKVSISLTLTATTRCAVSPGIC